MSEQPPNSPPPAAGPPPEPPVPAFPQTPAPQTGVPVAPPALPQGYRPLLRPAGFSGRRYGFLCSYCSSRLEGVESQAGQSGTCPTCGNAIVIPLLDYRGRLIDPTSGQIIKQDPHPVHAYAAAGHKAPQIIGAAGSGDRFIRCPRCLRNNILSCNNCQECGLPFTMEGTVGDAMAGTNAAAVTSLVLGIVSVLLGFVFVVPPILALIFGIVALRNTNPSTGQTNRSGLAIAGLILGALGMLASIYFWAVMVPHL